MLIKQLLKPLKLRYNGKKTLGPNAYVFTFQPLKPLVWKAGQHAILEILLHNNRRSMESFPIVSAPGESSFKIVTKIIPESHDVFKQALLKLKIGEVINTRGLFGRTIIRDHSKEYAFLTAGVGMASFRAILKQLILDGHLNTKITLFFVGNKESHYFKDEIRELEAKLKNLEVEYIYKPERITGQILQDKLGDRLQNITYFLAGSPIIVRNYRRILLGLGIKPRNIKNNHYPLIRHHQHNGVVKPPQKPNLINLPK
jgi:NAD(P)H-flavin reductase